MLKKITLMTLLLCSSGSVLAEALKESGIVTERGSVNLTDDSPSEANSRVVNQSVVSQSEANQDV